MHPCPGGSVTLQTAKAMLSVPKNSSKPATPHRLRCYGLKRNQVYFPRKTH